MDDKTNWTRILGKPPTIKDPECICCVNNHDFKKLKAGDKCCRGCVAADPVGGLLVCSDRFVPAFE